MVGHDIIDESPDVVVHEPVLRHAFTEDLSQSASALIDVVLVGEQEVEHCAATAFNRLQVVDEP